MDGPSQEQSDSDSGESWTLLENNSIYADDAPDFIDEQPKCEAQHHEKDEDTDGISIISDSDHETQSHPLVHSIFEKRHLAEHLQAESDIPEYDPITPDPPNVNDDDQETEKNNDFLGDIHVKHKTYVHRRNKRLSTVLNIIVLGSVITAAGVAIGHMWGAKNDCTMPTPSSVNKILSNLYKLQEENAYLRSKLKELTFNSRHIQQQKTQPKLNKCRRVFEDSLSNNEPRQLTKCVDENYHHIDNLMGHLVKPKFEKEFVADIDKLKTVYLQNKNWLDDEISRRLKIEEELLKKYKNEVNSAKEQNKELVGQKDMANKFTTRTKNPSSEETLDEFLNFENPTKEYDYNLQKKVTYADSLQTAHPSMKGDEKRETKGENDDWFKSKHNINNLNEIKPDLTWNEQLNQNLKSEFDYSDHADNSFLNNNKIDLTISSEQDNKDEVEGIFSDNWTEVKPKFRRNEERYETHHDNAFLESKQKIESKLQKEHTNQKINSKSKYPDEKRYMTDDNSWSNRAQEIKKKEKKEKGDCKEHSDSWKNKSNEDRVLENASNEEFLKDDRYVVNKLKQEKKRKGYVNSNKKQKRKNKNEKWNIKGEFIEGFEIQSTPEDYVLTYGKHENNFDHISFAGSIEDINRVMDAHKQQWDKPEKVTVKEDKLNKKLDNKEQAADWFEKRAVFRKEARKKFYDQFGDTSPNNSSWYFRRMRKREQCRAKGDNSTLKKMYKGKKNNKVKH